MGWEIEFFSDANGNQPVRKFLKDLDYRKRNALIAAIETVLEPMGLDVCQTEYGKALGRGLYEFRLRHDEETILRKAGRPADGASSTDLLLRVFFLAYGEKIILLLGAYDKGLDPSKRRQEREIARARRRLRSFELKQQRLSAAAKRQP
ncbi:hypothetical protein [Conexibacter arvalis]|uniref:Phage-related protein n=1 Tax=Conexibacter arvalis TaxID=912552 RepID=A0A840IEM8_9ACTN|nr:hypothetical protein [Conexibacter arvalis]MBB4663457.1 phage-related protein [Conexibacter arvalis]